MLMITFRRAQVLLLAALFGTAFGSVLCPLNATELATAPATILPQPVQVFFDTAFTSLSSVSSSLRPEVAGFLGVDVARICVADVRTSTESPAAVTATVIFFADYLNILDGHSASELQTLFLSAAGIDYSTQTLRLGDLGASINNTRTVQPLLGTLRRCRASSRFQDEAAACSDPVPKVSDPNDESMEPLAWGLAGGILFLNILAAVLMWRGYTTYEEEATSKQEARIQARLAKLAVAGDLRSSMILDQYAQRAGLTLGLEDVIAQGEAEDAEAAGADASAGAAAAAAASGSRGGGGGGAGYEYATGRFHVGG